MPLSLEYTKTLPYFLYAGPAEFQYESPVNIFSKAMKILRYELMHRLIGENTVGFCQWHTDGTGTGREFLTGR